MIDSSDSVHFKMMQRALDLAARADGQTSPNPVVGCVLVKDNSVIGEGYHRRAGRDHAEVAAIRSATAPTQGATAYVTLEPCCHQGKTPPCTSALIDAGVTVVYYAVPDPNPLVAGGGHKALEAAGIEVHAGLLQVEATQMNRPFFHFIRTKRPYVIVKYAMSLDGKIATRSGHSQWISNEQSRGRVHQLRQLCDAIMVGTGTVIKDNPRLTVRNIEAARHPLRVILDRYGRIPPSHHVLNGDLDGQTMLCVPEGSSKTKYEQLSQRGIQIARFETHQHGFKLQPMMTQLAQCGIVRLMVEGGATLLGALHDLDLVDEVWAFISPRFIGGSQALSPLAGRGIDRVGAPQFGVVSCESLAGDTLIRAQRQRALGGT